MVTLEIAGEWNRPTTIDVCRTGVYRIGHWLQQWTRGDSRRAALLHWIWRAKRKRSPSPGMSAREGSRVGVVSLSPYVFFSGAPELLRTPSLFA